MAAGEGGIDADKSREVLSVYSSMPHVPVPDKMCRAYAGMLQNAGSDVMKAASLLLAMQKKNRDRKPCDATDQNASSPCTGNRGKSIEGRQLHATLLLWEPENCGTVYRDM